MEQFYQRTVDFFQEENQHLVNICLQQIVVGSDMPNFIKHFRKARKLSTADLATLVGTSPQQINFLEKGKRELTWTWSKRLAMHLDCRPIELLEGPGAAADISLTDREAKLLKAYRTASEDARRMIETLISATAFEAEKKGAAKNKRSKTGA